MITVKQAAEKWGVSTRRVQMLCKEGAIEGAVRWERTWMIPANTVSPIKAREREPKDLDMPMPKKTPFLHMTDLYSCPGTADQIPDLLLDNYEARTLYEMGIAYTRGEMETVRERAGYFLQKHSGFYAVLAGGIQMALCAIWLGDLRLWTEAKQHMCEAPCKSDQDREIVSLGIAAVDSMSYDIGNYPEWFKRGCMDILPPDALPAARVFYIQYLHMVAHIVASKQYELDGITGLSLMRMIPNTIEPMITQARVEKTVIPEIHLRLLCASAYHNSGDDAHAVEHIDKAIALALPDRLYGIFLQYIHSLDRLLEQRLNEIDETAAVAVKELYKKYSGNWAKIRSIVQSRNIASNLTAREREIAKLSSFGFTIKEIAAKLYIAESTVKQTIFNVVRKTGLNDRSELASIL